MSIKRAPVVHGVWNFVPDNSSKGMQELFLYFQQRDPLRMLPDRITDRQAAYVEHYSGYNANIWPTWWQILNAWYLYETNVDIEKKDASVSTIKKYKSHFRLKKIIMGRDETARPIGW